MKELFYILSPIIATFLFLILLLTCNMRDEEPIEKRHRQEITIEEGMKPCQKTEKST